MKNIYIKIISFVMAVLLFVSYPISVYASNDHPWEGGLGLQLYYNLDEIKQYIKDTAGFWIYYAHQLGAVVHADFTKFVENSDKFDELLDDENVGLYKDDVGNVKGVYTSKNFMAQLKVLLDEYAKENQPYFVKSTRKATQIPASAFSSRSVYNAFIDYSKSHYMFFFRFNSNGFNVYDFTPEFKEGGGFYNAWRYATVDVCNKVLSVDSDWNTWDGKPCYYDYYEFKENADGDMVLDTIHEKAGYFTTNYGGIDLTLDRTDFRPSYNNICFLVTQDGGNIRIYQSISDLKNYSVGQRKVYYTSNYYDYVPEDLTVSIDELQKTIEDMQDVIDKLLDQITDNTSESEIEELLRQILEELRKNPGTGEGGGGSDGGDINVDIDLSTTNSLLSNILAKVTQIYDKISQTVGGAADTAGTKIQETLDEILVQIKKLKHWTMADTVVGAADAVADWIDLLKDLFSGADDAAESVVGAISTTMDDAAQLMKTKFPFCIPWDVYLIVGFLAEEPQTPVFRLPIKLERLGIEEYIEINLEDFEVVSSMSRTFLTLLYCYALLNLTMKVFPITKEGGD